MKNKIIRNIFVFGIILYVINYALNFIIDKILELVDFSALYDINAILYTIVILVMEVIVYLISMVITKKIISLKIKIKINYEEAKKMLFFLLIIVIVITCVEVVVEYISLQNTFSEMEQQFNDQLSEMEEFKSSDEFELIDESTQEEFISSYESYNDYINEMKEFIEQRNIFNIFKVIYYILMYSVCLYGFGLFIYRKENLEVVNKENIKVVNDENHIDNN